MDGKAKFKKKLDLIFFLFLCTIEKKYFDSVSETSHCLRHDILFVVFFLARFSSVLSLSLINRVCRFQLSLCVTELIFYFSKIFPHIYEMFMTASYHSLSSHPLDTSDSESGDFDSEEKMPKILHVRFFMNHEILHLHTSEHEARVHYLIAHSAFPDNSMWLVRTRIQTMQLNKPNE